jgi:hypothetical protein
VATAKTAEPIRSRRPGQLRSASPSTPAITMFGRSRREVDRAGSPDLRPAVPAHPGVEGTGFELGALA